MDPLTEPRRSMGNEVLNHQLGGLYGRWNLGDTGRTEVAPSCPRCASPNTKFCYYNNYSLSQPRYFCKSCRRYWTKGGSLRNVPVGGGCRKSRRSRAARASKAEASPLTPLNGNSNSSGSEDLNERDRISVNDLDAPKIDLAMVFAKFLNPDSCPEPELHPLNYIDQESPIAAASTDPLYAMMPDYVFDPMMLLPQEIAVGKQLVSEAGEFMIGSESSALGLMPVDLSAEGDLNRPMPGDGLWLDAEPPLPNYTWQQPETSPSDDSWKIDLSADRWSSTFDHSGFEILSRLDTYS